MDNKVRQRVDEIKQSSFNVSIGDVFSKAWEIFSGIAAYAIVALVIYGVVLAIASSITGLIYTPVSTGIVDMDDLQEFYVSTFTAPLFILSQFISVIISAAVSPMLFSILTMAKKFENNEIVGINDIFVHYSDGKFMNIFLTYLAIQILGSIGVLLCVIPGIIFQLATVLAVPFVIFGNATAGDAIKSSISVAFKNFGTIFIFGLATFGVILLGALACIIGLIAAIPLVYIALYVLYKEIIGFDDNQSEIDELGKDIYSDNPYMK